MFLNPFSSFHTHTHIHKEKLNCRLESLEDRPERKAWGHYRYSSSGKGQTVPLPKEHGNPPFLGITGSLYSKRHGSKNTQWVFVWSLLIQSNCLKLELSQRARKRTTNYPMPTPEAGGWGGGEVDFCTKKVKSSPSEHTKYLKWHLLWKETLIYRDLQISDLQRSKCKSVTCSNNFLQWRSQKDIHQPKLLYEQRRMLSCWNLTNSFTPTQQHKLLNFTIYQDPKNVS